MPISHHLTQKSPVFLYQNTLFTLPSQKHSRCTFSNSDSVCFLSSHSHARIYPDQSMTQYSHHSGFLVPLSLCRLCVNHPPTQLTRCPHGCPRKQKMSGRKSSPHCAKLSSNGRNGAYVPSSSLQSSLYLAALLAGQSCAVNSNLPSHSWTAFFITTSSHHNHELYNQQNFAFIYTLRTFIPLTIC